MDIQKNVNFPQPVEKPVENVGIVIDDGTEEVPITNLRGQRVGVFYVRPTDLGIVHRYDEFVKGFDSILEPIQRVNLNSDGSAKDRDHGRAEGGREAAVR